MLKRIDRAKVDKIVGELLKRVAQINADPELCHFVNEIRLFGIAMDGNAASFGDVDIAYDLVAGSDRLNTSIGTIGRTRGGSSRVVAISILHESSITLSTRSRDCSRVATSTC
jgi:hypothetical protein